MEVLTMRRKTNKTGMKAGLSALLLLFVLNPVAAQPELKLRWIDASAFPTITNYITVKCDQLYRYNLDRSNFTVKENGVPVQDFTISCPPQFPCCISAALVLDRSGSMNGAPLDSMKSGVKSFIDLLDVTCDEAAVVSFSSNVTTDVPVTSDTAVLKAGVDALVASGSTALWDGTGVGITELIDHGTQGCRGVIVTTDGGDNSSTVYSLDTCIALAQRNKIRVFTVAVGNGAILPPLQRIADETGGAFFRANSLDELRGIYKQIYTIMHQNYGECTITFESSCPDGSTRTVEIIAGSPVEFPGCAGSDSVSRTYTAPYRPNEFAPAFISLDSVRSDAGGLVSVPLRLNNDIDGLLTPATFRLRYDPTCVQWVSFNTEGAKFDGLSVTFTGTQGGLEFTLTGERRITGHGVLGVFQFRTVDMYGACRECKILLEGWSMEKGCITPVLGGGLISFGVPALSLSAPDPASEICRGSSVQIKWEAKCIDNVAILLSNDGGISWTTLASAVPAKDGAWPWTANVAPGNRYRIRIIGTNDTTLVAETASDFSITSAPLVQQQPSDVTACEKTQAVFSAVVSGFPAPGIQWQVSTDGGATFVDMSGQKASVLSLPSVTITQSGTLYRVRVSNDCGEIYSDVAALTVTPLPTVAVTPQFVSLCVGGTGSLIGRVQVQNQTFQQWQKKDVTATTYQDIPGETRDTLVITAAAVNQSGTRYRLAVGNGCDTVYSQPSILGIKDIPLIQQQPLDVSVCEGDSVILRVIASNTTAYRWEKDGTAISGADSSILVLPAASMKDAGAYMVTVVNTCGSVSSKAVRVEVTSGPAIANHPASRSASVGDTVRFEVRASGVGLQYQWWKDGAALGGAQDSVLVIGPVRKGDEGKYVVVVRNKCGFVRSDTAYLSVTVTSIAGMPESASGVVLFQNYPNPLGNTPLGGGRRTAITYTLPTKGRAVLRVFSIRGKEVATLVDAVMRAGRYVAVLDASALRPGVYYYRLEFIPDSQSFKPVIQTRKLVITQ